MIEQISSFARDESGAAMIEYGLIAALVAVAAIVALESLAASVSSMFTAVSTKLNAKKPQ